MTKRQSGLPHDDRSSTVLTSLCNHESGDKKRAIALLVEQAIKKGQRYETVTLTDLASWPAAVEYSTLPKRLQDHVLELYTWTELRQSSMCYHTMQEAITQQFEELEKSVRDTLASELCDIHTVIEFTLRTQVLPDYITNHITGGAQTLHWESLAPGSPIQLQRQRTLLRIESKQASARVPGAKGKLLNYYDWGLDQSDTGMLHLLHRDIPSASRKRSKNFDIEEDEEEDDAVATNTITISKSTAVIASTFITAMHTAITVLGREAHPRSILCPLTSTEWNVLVNGYGIPESMLQGNKVTPRFNYATCGGVVGEVTSEWEFLKYRSAQPFFRDLYMGQVVLHGESDGTRSPEQAWCKLGSFTQGMSAH
jgi:hypothetical protein